MPQAIELVVNSGQTINIPPTAMTTRLKGPVLPFLQCQLSKVDVIAQFASKVKVTRPTAEVHDLVTSGQ